MAVERGDDQLRRLLQPIERLIGVEAEVVLELWRDLREHLDVGPGGEELLARAAQDDDVHGIVHARVEDAGIERLVHLVGVGVRGRIVQLEDGHAVLDAIFDEGV